MNFYLGGCRGFCRKFQQWIRDFHFGTISGGKFSQRFAYLMIDVVNPDPRLLKSVRAERSLRLIRHRDFFFLSRSFQRFWRNYLWKCQSLPDSGMWLNPRPEVSSTVVNICCSTISDVLLHFVDVLFDVVLSFIIKSLSLPHNFNLQ